MALSFYSYSDTLDHLNPDMVLFQDQQSEVAEALFGFCEPLDAPQLPLDCLFDPPDTLLYSGETDSSTLFTSFSQPSLSLAPDQFPPSDAYDVYRCPKRPRSCGDLYHSSDLMFEPPTAAPLMISSYRTKPEFLAEFVVPPPPPPGFSAASNRDKKTSNGCPSAQSVAARERRKRISEKTQELGRLIPGGNKMNTAEMFQAAYKYVKFLQAQVGILGILASIEGETRGSCVQVEDNMQLLLTSLTIQEKLHGEARCLVPKQAMEVLAEDNEIKSNPTISRDVSRFVESIGRTDASDEKESI